MNIEEKHPLRRRFEQIEHLSKQQKTFSRQYENSMNQFVQVAIVTGWNFGGPLHVSYDTASFVISSSL